MSIFIPRDKLIGQLKDPDGIHLSAVDPSGPLSQITTQYLVTLQRTISRMTVHEAEKAVGIGVDLIAECLNGQIRHSESEKTHKAATVAVVKRMIRQRARAGAQLDVDTVVRLSGWSRASLFRMFEPLGGIARLIREERLRAALRQLSGDAPIGDIAIASGFNSATHFTRVFKQTYGVTPRDARQALHGKDEAVVSFAHTDKLDRRWELWLKAIGAL